MILPRTAGTQTGSVLILVLWISFGLVTLTLYFAHAMTLELRAADNRSAQTQARLAVDGAARYVQYILSNYATNGSPPSSIDFATQALPIGLAYCWLIGRTNETASPTLPSFGLVDEASRLNLNTATLEMLEALPRMTPELAASIIDWRDEDEDPTENGAEGETYARLTPPRHCKNAPFESVEELRLVYGATLDILFGEDVNRNGILDPNENDGEDAPPTDNRDGRLDPGILDLVTVYSRLPNTRSDGSTRFNITTPQGRNQLAPVLTEKFGEDRANEILQNIGGNNVRSVLQFYAASRMTAEEYDAIRTDITAANGSFVDGLVNINTASEAVLACIPGIGTDQAPSITAFRISNPDRLDSLSWVPEVLEAEAIAQAGPFLTDQTHQFTADVAAVGRFGRGYYRARFVFDTTEATPRILLRQDQTSLGWALSTRVRQDLAQANLSLQ